MSLLKTTLDCKAFQTYLQEVYPSMSSLELLKGGEVSQAYAFRVGDRELVVKLRDSEEEYRKEAFVADLCVGSLVPVPKVERIGAWQGLFYLLSERASGKTLNDATQEEMSRMLPKVFEMLENVHAIALPGGGFGFFDESGVAPHTTWKEALRSIFEDAWYEWDAFKKIPQMQDGTFVKLYGAFEHLLTQVPEDRVLIHTDCSFDNICAKDGEVTGLFDWEMAMYGDALYDVAWMDFWHENYDIAERYLQWISQKGVVYTLYRERILCYQLHFGLRTLAFYRKAGLWEQFAECKKRLLEKHTQCL